jgi:hypothetical protein
MVKVGVRMPGTVEDAGDFLANVRALESAGAALITVDGEGEDRWVLLAAIAVATERVRVLAFEPSPPTLRALGRGRLVTRMPEGESWADVAVPPDRAGWASMLGEKEKAGVAGVIVPWDPRLIDLLRNPEPDDRSDLLMSTG